ncbi:leucine_Rich Repeat (LRR)-containing protein [Hexamita inflata]|uniref:Leucine Rich Repeat (LRR)-containing protein n=1 Tax=Hexamita inflata TaxID=28002 RepID=A0AA86Q1N0_9EUKA|nr:leucine Rich Repeat (LRR)-containing protein [Hexamita inflata]
MIRTQQEYNAKMKELFKNQLQDGIMEFYRYDKLKWLAFMQDYDVSQLKIYKCYSIIPIITNNTITELHLEHCRLQNITQIQLMNLSRLNVSQNYLSDDSIKHICKFKRLRYLNLSQNVGIDISPLKSLVDLVELNVCYCEITDIRSLQHLQKLQRLDIGFNLVTYIKPLQYLYELKHVDFYGNYIVDFSEIRNHENYNYYHINGQQEPTQLQLNYTNQLQYMDNAADYIDNIEQQSHWISQRIMKLKSQRQQLNSILIQLNHYKISFSEQSTSLFQQLNYNDCQ